MPANNKFKFSVDPNLERSTSVVKRTLIAQKKRQLLALLSKLNELAKMPTQAGLDEIEGLFGEFDDTVVTKDPKRN